MSEIPAYTLSDGFVVPAIALGTYNLRGFGGVSSMLSGIEAGYRMLDSAFNYENEGAVGQAVRRSGLPREELRLVSKLPGRHQRYEEALETVEESLMRAGLDYWDMYLIHWPNPARGLYVEAFQALLDARARGLVRSVGVCNFLPEHLERLREETGEYPSVNQIELHPYFPQPDALAYHERVGVRTQSWSPLGRKWRIVEDPAVVALAEHVGVSPARLILRCHYQLGTIPLPKSGSAERQRDNLDIFSFSLSSTHMAAMSALGRPDGRQAGQDPAVYEEF